jgi:hypothetical protein
LTSAPGLSPTESGIFSKFIGVGKWFGKNWKTALAVGSFGACLVVSAGLCVAIGLIGAGLNYASDAHQYGLFSKKAGLNLLINLGATFGGGYVGKGLTGGGLKLTKGWSGSTFSREWPEGEWLFAPRTKEGGPDVVNWAKTGRNIFFNGSDGLASCTITFNCSLIP